MTKNRIIIFTLLLTSALFHAWNMFHYPYYEGDEGTYMSQAWSLVTFGKIAPYTFWYDHAPGGWMMIALWTKLIGGFFVFGTSINTGRVLLLLIHLALTYLVFDIVRKLTPIKSGLTGNMLPAILSVIIFSVSPLAISYQRLVLLDNIMIFWVMLAFWLLLQKTFTLTHMFFSSICFGIGVLSKENAIFFIPGFLYTLWIYSHPNHRRFALGMWIAVAGSIISLYFLYAFLKFELFPTGFLGDTKAHVSLFSTLQLQLQRGVNLPVVDKRSDFYTSFTQWWDKDRLFMVSSILTTIIAAFLSIWDKRFRMLSVFLVSFWVFLIRSKLVINFYIIPLIPFAAITIGLLGDYLAYHLNTIFRYITHTKSHVLYAPFVSIVAAFFFLMFLTHGIGQYTRDETTPQIKTISWIKSHLKPSDHIIIDDTMYVDLHDKPTPKAPVYSYADWFWKVEDDPQVQKDNYHDDWKYVDYIVITPDMLAQLKDYTFLKQALAKTQPKQLFTANSPVVKVRDYYSSNESWVAVYKMQNKDTLTLQESWQYYKKHFIHSYGQVIDPQTNTTTSEGQSYAMLRALWENDKYTYDGVWHWTKDHMQYRTTDKLLSWQWDVKKNKLADTASASDADEDIAMSLLFAYRRWGDQKYLDQAKTIISDIWKKEVVNVHGAYYLTSGTSAKEPDGYLVNPSYFSPAAYAMFAEIDPQHPWNQLSTDGYKTLNQIVVNSSGTGEVRDEALHRSGAGLPPNWFLLHDNGAIATASKHKGNADVYSYDAFRVMYRVALDALWFHDPRATAYLQNITPFFKNQWQQKKSFAAEYDMSGNPKVRYGRLSVDSGSLAAFLVTDPSTAKAVYQQLFAKKFQFDGNYWDDKTNYYDQNWAWFATALYQNSLPNLWQENTQVAAK